MKRSLSDDALPPPKRLHTLNGAVPVARALTFESALYEELILLVFSYLDWRDLCAAQVVNTTFRRVAQDQTLWKRLFLRTFRSSRLRGGKGFIGRTDGREMKPIPGRAQQPPEPKEWREWFQISYRWRTGRCTTQELIGGILEPRSGAAATSTPHHILLAGSTTIIASSEASGCPQIHCLQAAANQTLRCGSSSPHPQTFHITAIALDQSPPALSGLLRLAVFLSTGEFIIFAIHPSNPVATTRKFNHIIQRRRSGQVVQAVYHHPLLISLSDTFVLNLYDLSSDTVRHSQTLSSVSTFPPSSMILSTQAPAPAPRSLVYKLVLTYAVPIYPLHLSLGVTELLISSHASSDSMSFTPLPNTAPLTVFSTRTARALDVPQGWIDQDKLRIMKEQWGRKLLRIQATQSDGKWVVLAPGEQVASTPSNAASGPQVTTIPTISGTSAASLQLYRLFLPAVTSIASPPPKLTFNRYLEHTAGTVSSMSLADGRCVTLGKNSVSIWDLESGTSAEVALPTSMRDEGQGGTIAFDDRRIITVRGSTVHVHRFD